MYCVENLSLGTINRNLWLHYFQNMETACVPCEVDKIISPMRKTLFLMLTFYIGLLTVKSVDTSLK